MGCWTLISLQPESIWTSIHQATITLRNDLETWRSSKWHHTVKKLKAKLRAQDWLTTLKSDYQRTLNLFLMYFTYIARYYIMSVIENTSCYFVTSLRFLFIYTIFILYMVLLCCKKSKLFVYFCLCHDTCGNLVIQSRINSMPAALEAWRLNYWATREAPPPN